MNHRSDRTRWLRHALTLALILLLFAVTASHLDAYLGEYDEGPLLQAPALANEGYRLYEDIVLNKPPLLTWWLRLGLALGGARLEVGRLFILYVNLLGYTALGALAVRLFGRGAGIATGLAFWATGSYIPKFVSVNVDLPALSLVTVALLAASRARSRSGPQARSHVRATQAFVAGGAFAAALAVQPWSISAALPLALLLLAPAIPRRPGQEPRMAQIVSESWPRLRRAGLAAAVVTAAWALPVISPAFVTWVYRYNTAPLGASLVQDLATRMHGLMTDYLQHRGLLTLGAILGALALVGRRRTRFGLMVTLAWLAATLATLTQVRPLWGRYHDLPVVPILLLMGGAAGQALRGGARSPGRSSAAARCQALAGVVVAGLALARFTLTPVRWLSWPETDLACKAFLLNHTTPEQSVITDDQLVAFWAGRRVPPALSDTSAKRISTGFLDTADVLNAVLQDAPPYLILRNRKLDILHPLVAWAETHAVEIEVDPGLRVFALPPQPLMATSLDARFGAEIRLLGTRVEQDPALRVTLFLQANSAPTVDAHVFVHVLDEAGTLVAQHDAVPFEGLLPTPRWQPGVTVPHTAALDAALAPGTYTLAAGLYTWPDIVRLSVTLPATSTAAVRNDSILLGSIEIAP